MSRRTAERTPRRIEVRFWRRANPQPHTGFTIDVSKSGIFLGTSVQFEPGERIRLELMDKDRGFLVEGQVARVHRVSLALRHLEQPGVGVRFLSPAELIQELVGNRGKPPVPTPQPPAAPSAPETGPATPSPSPSQAVSTAGGGRQITVEFVDRASFLNVYHRDISSGGLFVSSAEPARMHEIVTVELRPPMALAAPLRFAARVVHCVDGESIGPGAPRGMGVQFLDPDRVRATLAPIVLELRR